MALSRRWCLPSRHFWYVKQSSEPGRACRSCHCSQDDGLDAALAAVQQSDPDIAMLVDNAMLRTTDADVALICALVASARGDADLGVRLCARPGLGSRTDCCVGSACGGSAGVDAVARTRIGA